MFAFLRRENRCQHSLSKRLASTEEQIFTRLLQASQAGIMSKVKPPKSKGIPSKHLHARTTFLYQAATYLTLQTAPNETANDSRADQLAGTSPSLGSQTVSPLATQLCSDLQRVSRKAQLRLSVDLKRSMCKRCSAVLVPGRTATQTLENTSKGGKKSWADVLVLKCTTCGGKKRFPVGAKKQLKKAERKASSKDASIVTSPEDGQPTGDTDSAAQSSGEVDLSTD